MPPENTTVVDDGSQKALKAKELEIEELKATVEKEKKRVENAEALVDKWSNEVGDLRKQKETFEKTIADAKAVVEAMEEKVKKASEGKQENTTEVKPAETPENIEAGLNDEQKKVGEEKFKELSNVEKIQYAEDPKFKVAFLKRLKTDAPIVPQTPWSTAKEEANEEKRSGMDKILDRVFKKKQQASYVPEGPQSNVSFGEPQGKPRKFEEDTRVH